MREHEAVLLTNIVARSRFRLVGGGCRSWFVVRAAIICAVLLCKEEARSRGIQMLCCVVLRKVVTD